MVLASHAGFCFGVRRAVGTAEKAAPAVTLGPIIHSPQVVERLRRMGIVPVDALEEIPDGVRAVIRSHGVDRATYDALARKGCEVVDATCPFVARIHDMAREASLAGIPLVVVGEAEHPEVRGILGWTDGEKYAVLSREDVERLPHLSKALVVSQTTMVEEKFRELCSALAGKIDRPDVRATVCPATRDRQNECVEIARKADVMIVIGGRESSNSRKLYRLAPRTR